MTSKDFVCKFKKNCSNNNNDDDDDDDDHDDNNNNSYCWGFFQQNLSILYLMWGNGHTILTTTSFFTVKHNV